MSVVRHTLSSRTGGQCRALVVDDNEINRRVLATILCGLGASVVQAENGYAACALAKDMHFDVILMDIEMPLLDGLTAIRRIRAREEEQALDRTPIIVVSAFNGSKDIAATTVAGADGHFEKPIRILSLLDAIQDAMTPQAGAARRLRPDPAQWDQRASA